MRNIRTFLVLLGASWPVAAQVWDNSGNNLLNGMYYFREVTITSDNAYATYGNINFTNGTYSINATQIQFIDANTQVTYTSTGTYSIAASGYGFIYNQYIQSNVYGLVGSNGVFVGSATESGDTDLFIAAPLASQAAGTLNGSYSLAYLSDPLVSGAPFGGLLQMSPNGAGKIGTVSLAAYTTTSTATNQSLAGVTYVASNGAYALTFPSSSTAMIEGPEYLYSTPDGSFVFGGSPISYDMLVGVRSGTSGASFGGLYYTAGFQVDNSQFPGAGEVSMRTYYGSFSANNGVILGHQRIQDGVSPYGYTYSDTYPATSGGSYSDSLFSTQFIAGNAAQIGVGIGPLPGISVALQAPNFSGSGVYLSPVGVQNSASYAPFTAGISRDEYITLTGTNLGPGTLQVASTVPFPATLGSVKVLINNIAAPIYYVSANQLAVVVPHEIGEGNAAVAQIQVINNGSASNVITVFVNDTTPGVFSEQEDGTGYGAVEHQNGSLVTPSDPAQIGEIVSVYMTGLGDVSPFVSDGSAAPLSQISNTNNTITADISGTPATVTFAGLAPGSVALYQVNLVIPAGVPAGDNFIDIAGPDSYNSEALISVAAAPSAVPGPAIHPRARPGSAKRRFPFAE